MRDDDLKIIDEFLNVCKVVHPDFKNSGTVMAVYKKGLKLMFPQYGEEEEDNE